MLTLIIYTLPRIFIDLQRGNPASVVALDIKLKQLFLLRIYALARTYISRGLGQSLRVRGLIKRCHQLNPVAVAHSPLTQFIDRTYACWLNDNQAHERA